MFSFADNALAEAVGVVFEDSFTLLICFYLFICFPLITALLYIATTVFLPREQDLNAMGDQ